MDEITCPTCQASMNERDYNGARVLQCSGCAGLFLPRNSLGILADAETAWHAHRATHTAPIPKITADMTAPPPTAPPARSFLDALFRG